MNYIVLITTKLKYSILIFYYLYKWIIIFLRKKLCLHTKFILEVAFINKNYDHLKKERKRRRKMKGLGYQKINKGLYHLISIEILSCLCLVISHECWFFFLLSSGKGEIVIWICTVSSFYFFLISCESFYFILGLLVVWRFWFSIVIVLSNVRFILIIYQKLEK